MAGSKKWQQSGFARHRLIGLLAGPVLASAILLSPAPEGLSQQGWWTAAVGILMATWWMTEALPLAATAMLPLVLFPGAGSELYRGLGTVVIGGLSLSAVLTLAIIPPLLALFASLSEGRRASRSAAAVPQTAGE